MFRLLALLGISCAFLLAGCAYEDGGPRVSSAEMNRIETYLNASLNLSLLCSEAPLDPQEAASADGNANLLLRMARSMPDDVLSEDGTTVREELHADASLYDSCMPRVAKKIRSALNSFPPPSQIYDTP